MREIERRSFIKQSILMGLGAGLLTSADISLAADAHRKENKPMAFKKAMITDIPTEAEILELKAAGFDGVEVNLMGIKGDMITREEAAKVREMVEKHGLRIHSVMRGWAEYNSPDPAKVKADQDYTISTMRAAQGLGADVILLVPGRVGGLKMPDRDKFKVKFDKQSGHISEVADGDNAPFKEYIEALNKAWDACRKSVQELIPVAEETGVIIAIENVWNNMFIHPEQFALFVDSFNSKWVRTYFDVANNFVYGPPPQDWIKILGKRLVKIHIKDYKLNPPDGNEWPSLREGSLEYPKIMAALKEAGYDGWLTIEGPCGDNKECSRRLDLIIEGK